MVDITKQIGYWQKGADEDWDVAKQLIDSSKIRHGLFFAHLALEKMLKAHYTKNKNECPPKIHNLLRIAELAEIDLDIEKKDVLSTINRFCMEGRYPDSYVVSPSLVEAKKYMQITKGILEWLKQRL